mmetsp:Transcript_7363/g.16696  ORF Transcript_7363/g.16696 Transcript_7363/m.16696 type:complete len:268 (-) Transcript_7363:82-885(-)|eukprot:CAMPEP_0172310152 /NCGR_PEP_ID=MMETSP1058-20130122/11323_1 /TAXON_ID=83371 /ORGANISM="Detonula confervacea, Strain CCMP 353" /LENGTH=267 /DNA_ID=CAMNT_0013022919 /DNA_START=17 /DNA_END=820 /DNA_ORIENTATION=-
MMALLDDLPRFGTERIPTIVSPNNSDSSLDGLQEEKAKLENLSFHPRKSKKSPSATNGRLNKFVRRLHEMLTAERFGEVVEWRRGLLILHSINAFSKEVLPKYFNTTNFKTFRRQLNYYGFLHVRSFSATSSAAETTALWVNQELADRGSDSISSVLKLKRVEPNEASKTPEGRRVRKNEAASSVEVNGLGVLLDSYNRVADNESSSCPIPKVVHCQQEQFKTYDKHCHVAPATPFKNEDTSSPLERNDPFIGHAAGLLLSLSHAAA